MPLYFPCIHFVSFLICSGYQGTSPSVGGTPSLDNPTHPIVPKRVAYYQASFDKTTNVNQVKMKEISLDKFPLFFVV